MFHFIKITLKNSTAIMMNTKINNIPLCILRKMNKSGATVLNDIRYQFLHNTKYQQFLFVIQTLPVIMKSCAGIDHTRSIYFFEEIFYRSFQSKVFLGRGHQAV